MIESSDISHVLSGGSGNTLAADSLGGEPSVTTVPARLFADVTDAESTSGTIDYRCIYIANDNASETLYHATVSIIEDVAEGATAELGFRFQNDTQQLIVANGTAVTSGTFSLNYDDQAFSVTANSDKDVWASNFQTALRAIENLEDVIVTASVSGIRVIFEIEFDGVAGNRYHPILTVNSTSLVPSTTISVSKTLDGSPVNRVADEVDTGKTAPNSIEFYSPTADSPLDIGQLRPNDMLPVWIKRECAANTDAIAGDGFTLRLQGQPID